MPEPELVRPPRPVPLSLRLILLFGGFSGIFGWCFFGFGMIFFWIFAVNADFAVVHYWTGTPKEGTGTVLRTEETRMKSNGRTAVKVIYTFEGRAHVSYVDGRRPAPGKEVTVEYFDGGPYRIRGMRGALLPLWIVFVVIFPLLGFIFLTYRFVTGIRATGLLANGRLGRGKLIDKQATNTEYNNQRVYKLTFEFEAADGRIYKASARSHRPETLEDEPEEQLLYDPIRPDRAVLLDGIIGGPEIDPNGFFRARRPGLAWPAMIAPMLTLIGHLVWLVLH